MCDASNSTLGAVLGQIVKVGKQAHMIAYVSRTMGLAQLNYTVIEKEMLAIPDVKRRLIRWMLLLQEFDIEIGDKKGVENSRIERESDPMPI
ncbi:Retrovirus-related Pol polyprotein, partial [Mucuna pruriens]